MAICHISATIGSKSNGTSAAARFAYICREGKWGKPAMLNELLTVPVSGNMPAWAAEHPARYWQAADAGERQNGRLFQQVIIALPRELPPPAQIALAESFARELAQTPQGNLPYTVATHRGGAKDENPHAHIIVSERLVDGIDRTADTWFRRAAASPQKKSKNGKAAVDRKTPAPETGGAKKSIAYQQPTWPEQLRSTWAERANESLEVNNRKERITPLSHVARGLDIAPTIKEGPPLRTLEKQQKLSVRQAKNVAIRQINEQILAAKEELKKLTESISNFLKSAALEIAERKKQAALKRAAKEKADAEAARETTKLRADQQTALPEVKTTWSQETGPSRLNKPQKPIMAGRGKSSEVTHQPQPKVPKAQETAVAESVQKSLPVKPLRPSVPSLVAPGKVDPTASQCDPIETEFIEFLKGLPFEDAVKYVRDLPNISKWVGTVSARDVFNKLPGVGGEPGPGRIWDEAKWARQRLEERKEDAVAQLKKTLAANEGWFGQKKDTPEILEIKTKITQLDLEIGQKELAIEKSKKLWKVEEPRCQQVADERNLKREQARRFGPFVTAGKLYVQQIQQQTRKEPEKKERSRSQTLDQGRGL